MGALRIPVQTETRMSRTENIWAVQMHPKKYLTGNTSKKQCVRGP